MKYKIFICVFLLLVTNSCARSFSFSEPHYVKYTDKIVTVFTKKVAKEKGFVLFGSGGGFVNKVNTISLAFNVYQCVGIKEARKMYVDNVEEFISMVNADEELRPYLAEYPFPPERFALRLFFCDPKHPYEMMNDNYLFGVSVREKKKSESNEFQKKLAYTKYLPDERFNGESRVVDIFEETYEQAYEKVYGHPRSAVVK